MGADADSVEVVPTAASSGASVTINGRAVASGAAYEAALTGGTTRLTIRVTAKDGASTKAYTVIVNKEGSNQVSAPYTYTDYNNYTDPFYPDTPGVFTVTQYMALFSDTEGATVKYTLDGSDPRTSDTAKVFDQTKFQAASGKGGAEVAELITIGADTGDDWDGSAKQTRVTLKAYASKEGMEDSAVASFDYTIDRMSKNEHKNRVLYEKDGMKVWQVIDYDSDKMYLIRGADRALFIDAGMAPAGANDLYELSLIHISVSADHPRRRGGVLYHSRAVARRGFAARDTVCISQHVHEHRHVRHRRICRGLSMLYQQFPHEAAQKRTGPL